MGPVKAVDESTLWESICDIQFRLGSEDKDRCDFYGFHRWFAASFVEQEASGDDLRGIWNQVCPDGEYASGLQFRGLPQTSSALLRFSVNNFPCVSIEDRLARMNEEEFWRAREETGSTHT